MTKWLLVGGIGIVLSAGTSFLGYMKGYEVGYRKGVDEYVGHLTRLKTASDNLRQKQVVVMNSTLLDRETRYKELEAEYDLVMKKYEEKQTNETMEWNKVIVPELYRD